MSDRVRIVLTVLLLIIGIAAATVGGCIRRYPAPVEPKAATMPYSAIATWRRIELPPAPDGALPDAALRLAVGPLPDSVFADTALVDGGEAGVTADGWDEATALVDSRPEQLVLIAAADVLDSLRCEWLAGLGDRVVVAAGVPGYGDDAPDKREAAEGLSRDPLGRTGLDAVCPEPEAEPEVEPEPEPEPEP